MSTEPARAAPKWLLAAFAVAFVVLTVLLVVFREPVFGFFGDPERVRALVERFGVAAPVATIVLGALQVIVAPVPGQFLGVVGGYLFGTWLGTLYSMLGLVLGTAAAIGIARYLGRPWVERFVAKERLERWDRVAGRWGPPVFFLAYLLPGLPDDLLSFVVGLSRLPFGPMLALSALGRLPGMLTACWLGANAGELPWWVWAVSIGGALVVAVVFMARSDRFEELSLALGEKLGRRRGGKDDAA